MADPDFLGMSDEEFMNASPPSGGEAPASGTSEAKPAEAEEQTQAPQENSTPAEQPVEAPAGNDNPHAEDANSGKGAGAPDSAASAQTQTDAQASAAETQQKPAASSTEDSGGDEKSGQAAEKPSQSTPDYKGFYERVMSSFKANGRQIELRSPEEAIQLMQMGANYTRKMQELAPQRKLLAMLQNSGMTDEGQLSFAIDLVNKNPEAIKKLIKDAGIDPMDIDTSVEPAYREGNHRVSDGYIAFTAVLDDLKSTQAGGETIIDFNEKWDQASKQAVWDNPEILKTIAHQRETGMYARVSGEVERQRMLGQIPGNIPFLQAYRTIGEKMLEAGLLNDLVPKARPAAPQVVATRVEAPKPAVANGDRASAASSNRTASKSVKAPPINPLAMSDEDFLKQMEGRL